MPRLAEVLRPKHEANNRTKGQRSAEQVVGGWRDRGRRSAEARKERGTAMNWETFYLFVFLRGCC